MLDVKRLHEVHYKYPNVPRGEGKTTYCFDSLLRLTQTGEFKKIAYITNDIKTARTNRIDFLEFVWTNANNDLKRVSDKLFSVELHNCEVAFFGREEYHNKRRDFEAIIEDYFYDI